MFAANGTTGTQSTITRSTIKKLTETTGMNITASSLLMSIC
jgi:hypothetical protein